MQIELLIFLSMIAVFAIGCFKFKLPIGLAMMLAAITGGLVGGYGIPIRHLVEGTFGYLDTILVIATAMIFMKAIQMSGALNAISTLLIEKFHHRPLLLLVFLTLVIMFPGMITGSTTASVITAGSLVAPVLLAMGIPMVETAAIIAMAGLLGMIAPPVNVPVMIIGGGVDMPYSGFGLPLAILTFPTAIFSTIYLGRKYVMDFNIESLKGDIDFESRKVLGVKIYTPIAVLILLMVLVKALPTVVPNLGLPLIFLISALFALFTGKKIDFLKACREGISDAMPVLAILMGVGMFIQIMTLTGVRGYIVVSCLSLPPVLLYVAIAITVPLFGAISAYGSASVLGVPFLLALISKDQILTASALSFIAALGDMMPPTALAGLFAAKVVGVDNYTEVLKKSIVPSIVIVIYGLLFIIFSKHLAGFLY
jgi:TRAP-type C4-dicarboxylate transport system permease large subunit